MDGYGLVSYSFSYPGYKPNMGWASETLVVDWASGLVDHVKAAHPAEPPVIYGWSLGSAVALAVSSGKPVSWAACVVVGVPFTSMWGMIMEQGRRVIAPWIWVADRWPSEDRAKKLQLPTLVMSATEDKFIKPVMHRSVYEAIPHGSKMLLEAPVGHNDAFSFSPLPFFQKHCAPRR
jgi:pimeloyl-ACP methyl ester carboxylesterase